MAVSAKTKKNLGLSFQTAFFSFSLLNCRPCL